MKKLVLFMLLIAALASCSDKEDLSISGQYVGTSGDTIAVVDIATTGEVAISVYLDNNTIMPPSYCVSSPGFIYNTWPKYVLSLGLNTFTATFSDRSTFVGQSTVQYIPKSCTYRLHR